MLSCTVQTRVLWQRSPQANVLILEDQACGGTVEKDVAIAATGDGEAKGLLDVVEDELA